MVGSSGKIGERAGPVTASARSLPSLTSAIAGGSELKYIETWPPTRSVSAGAEPL